MSTWYELSEPDQIFKLPIIFLNGANLIIGQSLCKICEIELYYYSHDTKIVNGFLLGPDSYVHQDPLQLTFGQVYFHRSGNSYRGGNYKGMDLTFSGKNVYFSILVRTIQNLSTGDVISGPCLVVNHILELLNYQSINDLVKAAGGGINFLTPNQFIYLQSVKECSKEPILYGPRVGLSDKYPQFKMLPYRFVASYSFKHIKKQKRQLQLYWQTS